MARQSKQDKMINNLALTVVDAWEKYKLGLINATAYNHILQSNLIFASLYLDAYDKVADKIVSMGATKYPE